MLMTKYLAIYPSLKTSNLGLIFYDSNINYREAYSSPADENWKTQVDFVYKQVEDRSIEKAICSKSNWSDFSRNLEASLRIPLEFKRVWKVYNRVEEGKISIDGLEITKNREEKLAFVALHSFLKGKNFDMEEPQILTNTGIEKEELLNFQQQLDKMTKIDYLNKLSSHEIRYLIALLEETKGILAGFEKVKRVEEQRTKKLAETPTSSAGPSSAPH
jgi:hypothetical protein